MCGRSLNSILGNFEMFTKKAKPTVYLTIFYSVVTNIFFNGKKYVAMEILMNSEEFIKTNHTAVIKKI